MSDPFDGSTPGLTVARYRRPFNAAGRSCEVILTSGIGGLESVFLVNGQTVARDFTPAAGPEAVRNHRLRAQLADGVVLDVEAGYVNWVTVGIAVTENGTLIHESHPGRRISYPERLRKMVLNPSDPSAPAPYDPGAFRRNKVPILVDVLLGILFFVVAKLTDLSTAALVGAGAGLALVILQRFVKVDLLGGLALFGVFMLLVSAGLAIVFQDDMAVKMRTTIVGILSASLFLGDGLLGGNRLGKGMARYLPYTDVDPGRLAIGMGVLGLFMAGLNFVVARLASTDVWLFYTTFVDLLLVMVLVLLVFRYARGELLPPRKS